MYPFDSESLRCVGRVSFVTVTLTSVPHRFRRGREIDLMIQRKHDSGTHKN